jgi:hypothetical protein
MGDEKSTCMDFVGKSEGNILQGRPRYRLEDNNKIGLKRKIIGTSRLDSSG